MPLDDSPVGVDVIDRPRGEDTGVGPARAGIRARHAVDHGVRRVVGLTARGPLRLLHIVEPLGGFASVGFLAGFVPDLELPEHRLAGSERLAGISDAERLVVRDFARVP